MDRLPRVKPLTTYNHPRFRAVLRSPRCLRLEASIKGSLKLNHVRISGERCNFSVNIPQAVFSSRRLTARISIWRRDRSSAGSECRTRSAIAELVRLDYEITFTTSNPVLMHYTTMNETTIAMGMKRIHTSSNDSMALELLDCCVNFQGHGNILQ